MDDISSMTFDPPIIDQSFILSASLGQVDNAMSKAFTSAKALGQPFDELAIKKQALTDQINKLIETGFTPESNAVATLTAQLQNVQSEMDNVSKHTIDMGGMLANTFTDSLVAFGEGLGNIASGTGDIGTMLESILGIVFDFTAQLGKAMIASGMAGIAFKKLISNPYLAVAAGVALIAVSSIARNMLQGGPGKSTSQGSDISNTGQTADLSGTATTIPALAAGGLVYGPSIIMAGDNPRANVDPEVVAPLSQLESKFGNRLKDNTIIVTGRLVAENGVLTAIIEQDKKRLNNLRP